VREEVVTDEIEATVSGFFTTHHRLESGWGTLGTLTVRGSGARSIFQAPDGPELNLVRTSWWRGTYELIEDGRARATARSPGIFSRRFLIDFDGLSYEVQPAGIFMQTWHLVDGAGVAVLEIRSRGVFRRGAYVTVLGEVDRGLLVFAYFLVYMRWQEMAAAAAAGAGGS
jgi:hypothetical protein